MCGGCYDSDILPGQFAGLMEILVDEYEIFLHEPFHNPYDLVQCLYPSSILFKKGSKTFQVSRFFFVNFAVPGFAE